MNVLSVARKFPRKSFRDTYDCSVKFQPKRTSRESWSQRTVCLQAGGTISYKEELEVTKKEELTLAVSGEPKE